MIYPDELLDLLDSHISFYAGVPDSLLKDFCACLNDRKSQKEHVISANEGNALALATGAYLATGKPALVYLQNSGLGNIVNPALSMTNPEVYRIPVLLLIGWRGEPNIPDEPQHIKQGKVTLALLDDMDIAYEIIDKDTNIYATLEKAITYLDKGLQYAFVVKKNSFTPYKIQKSVESKSSLEREPSIELILDIVGDKAFFVATTGKISREVFDIREKNKQSHERDFLTVGSMGHSSQIAAGVALNAPNKKIICLDGDGSMLMHMGGVAVNSQLFIDNMIHIVLNNGCHDSVGGQPTVAKNISLFSVAKSFGFTVVVQCADEISLIKALKESLKQNKPTFIEVLVKKGSRKDLSRPSQTPQECKNNFMNLIQS